MTAFAIRRSALLESAGFPNGFCERTASAEDLATALGVPRIVQVKQVHGSRALEAHEAKPGDEADALIGRARLGSVAVGVHVADCVPLLVAGPLTGDVAAIHAGWRGIVGGVLCAALESLNAPSLLLAIGPCIGSCCFEVGADVGERISRACGNSSGVTRREGERLFVDLRAAIHVQLASLGALKIVVDDVVGCTRHEPDRYHSYRRDGAGSGRMMAAVRTQSSKEHAPR
jgi:YfiH family protein